MYNMFLGLRLATELAATVTTTARPRAAVDAARNASAWNETPRRGSRHRRRPPLADMFLGNLRARRARSTDLALDSCPSAQRPVHPRTPAWNPDAYNHPMACSSSKANAGWLADPRRAVPASAVAVARAITGAMFDPAVFAARRDAFMQATRAGCGVAVVRSLPERLRNGDAFHPFRQHSDIVYLTGFVEPDYHADPAARRRDREVRDVRAAARSGDGDLGRPARGPRGCEGDATAPTPRIRSRSSTPSCGELIANHDELHYGLGLDEQMDRDDRREHRAPAQDREERPATAARGGRSAAARCTSCDCTSVPRSSRRCARRRRSRADAHVAAMSARSAAARSSTSSRR